MFVQTIIIYIFASLAEIFGCFSFWYCLKMNRTLLWIVPGGMSLLLFAYLLTLVNSAEAGRSYAIYGGIYIISALLWLWIVEGVCPDIWDISGAILCLAGVSIIFFGRHHS